MVEREATRLRIWEVDCALLDAVLLMSFDARELANLARAAGVEVPACACPDARAVVRTVHRVCHGATPLALHLERLLDLVHGRAVDALRAYGLDAFAADLTGRDLWEVSHVSGRLWAVLTCADPAADRVRAYLRNAVAIDALRALAARVGDGEAA